MDRKFCCVPVSPMRAEPSHRAEMVSQLIFGEKLELLESGEEGWIRIRCLFDGYEGWIQSAHALANDGDEAPVLLTTKWSVLIHYSGEPMHLPLGSILPKKRGKKSPIQLHQEEKSTRDPAKTKPSRAAIKRIAGKFLNTGYLWGGKTVFGADCSGFTQTVFRMFNIALLRDAWQQATQGVAVANLAEAVFGDLAFFDNAAGKITHVGLILGKNKIIHASGKVRIDEIVADGIVNSESGEKTHTLKCIRRFL